ncbi:MAG: hypothetical protein OXU26_17555 [Acidobacteriota bacterium]|nr:hypothetical protein [Acidobacteriota bacterium]MDE2965717.1 hypothetical protein [Acidobacteriota bacterium]
MNLTLHLVAWDLRYLRPYLGLWLGLVVLQAVLVGYAPHLPLPQPQPDFFLSPLAWLVAVLKICLLAVLVARLVHKDPTVGSTAFWLSRPLSRARLLSGKSLVLLVAVVLPTLLVEVGLLFVCGVTPYDTFRSVSQILLLTVLALAVLMMLATVTTSLAGMILAGGLALFGVPLLWVFFSMGATWFWLLGGEIPPGDGVAVAQPIPPPSFSSYFVVNATVLLLTAGALVGFQYLTRRTTWSRVLLGAGVSAAVCGALLSLGYWSQGSGAALPVRERLDKAIPDPERIEARVEEGSLMLSFGRDPLSAFGLRGGKRVLLKGSIGLAPLPPDLAALPMQVSAKLLSPSGETLVSHVSQSGHFYGFPERRGQAGLGSEMSSLLGQTLKGVVFLNSVTPYDDTPFRPGHPELFAFGKDLYDRHRSGGVDLTARVDFLIRRHSVTVIQLEEGSGFEGGVDRTAILSVGTFDRGRWIVRLSEVSHRLPQDGRRQSTYLLLNRSRGQALAGWDLEDSLSMPPLLSFALPMLRVRRLQLSFFPSRDSPPIDPGWIHGAELVRVASRDVSWISKSIRLEDLVMDRIANPPWEEAPPADDG